MQKRQNQKLADSQLSDSISGAVTTKRPNAANVIDIRDDKKTIIVEEAANEDRAVSK